MQTKVLSAAILAIALLSANGASAAVEGQFRAQVKLVTPVAAPTTTVVNKVGWTCEGDTCEGDTCVGVADRSPGLDSFMKQCRKVRTALGPLTAYSSRGVQMSASNVANCNQGPR